MTPLSEVIAGLKRNRYEVPFALEREVRVGMEQAAKLSRSFIGVEQVGWSPLSHYTLVDKQRGGYETPKPLLRTAALRDSIVGEAETTTGGVEGIVGTNDPHALTHELGSSREPARPFLGPGLLLTLPALGESLGALAVRILTPGKKP